MAVVLATLSAQAQQPLAADAIMAHLAANQDAAESARSHYLYTQHAHIASRKGKTVHCEETTDVRITPAPAGSNRRLLHLDGRLLQKGKYTTYTQLAPPEKPTQHENTMADDTIPKPATAETDDDDVHISVNTGDDDMDRDLVENLRRNLTVTHSRDSISANLFPLTSKEQAGYKFTLLGRELRNGRDSFHFAFAPKDPDDFTWKGDAWIDATAFQPIVIRTAMSRKIPLAVRMLLGTNIPGLGFTIVYAPQPATQSAPPAASPVTPSSTPADAVWFPTSFGTEFKIHVLFFFSREIVFNAENRDFQQTHTSAEIHDNPSPYH